MDARNLVDQQRFREATRARNWAALRVAAAIVWILEPIYWLFDRVLLPGHERHTLAMRAFLFALALALHAFAARDGGAIRRHDRSVTLLLALAVGSSMNLLVFWDGGPGSDYFVGLMFVMIAVAFLFSWPLWLMLAYSVGLLVPYLAQLLWVPEISPNTFSHVLYVLTTMFVTGVSQHFRQRLEEREFFGNLALERTTESLEEALEKLKEVDRLKSQFFNTITHELRTPLTMIMAPVDVMVGEDGEQVDDQTRQRYLQSIWKNSLKLLTLINNLLDLAKLAEQFLRLQLTQSDLQEPVEEIIDHVRPLAARKDIELSLEVVATADDLHVDLEKFERVVVNLLSNALKFTSSGGRVRVLLNVTPDTALVEVHDTGVGIPADKLEAIFGRFTQADAGISRQFGGTGIGLAFVREIVELHRGTVEVESVVGEGSVFRVCLPRGTDHLEPHMVDRRRRRRAPSGDLKRAEDQGPTEWSQSLTRRADYRFFDLEEVTERRVIAERDDDDKTTRVLIVEDNPEIIRFVSVLLSAEHAVYAATDGKQGLDLALRALPDLIVTDYMMPEMDGVTLIGELRARPETADIPIIMLSAKADVADREEARGRGADVYIAKPFSPRELQIAVRRELQKRGAQVRSVLRAQTRSIEHISAGLAHEIHNPLSYIRNASVVLGETLDGLTVALARWEDDPPAVAAKVQKARERLVRTQEVIETGVGRIRAVVDLMRRYAREGFPTEPSDVYLDAIVRDVMQLVVPPETAQVTIDVSYNAPEAVVVAIPEELQQAVRNVIQNAVDAVSAQPGDNGAVRVRTYIDGNRAVVHVADNGPGISREDRARIFAPFYTTKKGGQGLGVGLAITQTVVEQSGGDIDVQSQVGDGTTMRLRLPFVERD